MTNGSSTGRTDLTPLVYTIPELSSLLRVSERHIMRLINKGEIPTVTLGARRVIPIQAFHDWFASVTVVPTPVA